MPYINIRLLDDKLSSEKKSELISAITGVMVDVLDKDPGSTFVVIDEINKENWGVSGISIADKYASRE